MVGGWARPGYTENQGFPYSFAARGALTLAAIGQGLTAVTSPFLPVPIENSPRRCSAQFRGVEPLVA